MAVDYTPTLKPYEKVGAFRYWCQTTLPLVYDDSKSYLELLYSVIHYLNSTISDVANMGDNIGDLLKAYNLLQGYVNGYFDNLDVQEEINNKLDEMASSGDLDNLLKPFVQTFVGEWLGENLTPTTPPIDKTLTIENAGADAKVVGDRLTFTLRGSNRIMVRAASEAQADDGLYTDFDTFPLNEVVSLQISGTARIAHAPKDEFRATVLTYAPKVSERVGAVQLFYDVDENKLYTRILWAVVGWTAWKGVPDIDQTLTISGAGADAHVVGDRLTFTLRGSNRIIVRTTSEAQAGDGLYTDFDTLPLNEVVTYQISGTARIAHAPKDEFKATVITYAPRVRERVGAVQIFYERDENTIYTRILWADVGWTAWKAIPSIDATLTVSGAGADAKVVGDRLAFTLRGSNRILVRSTSEAQADDGDYTDFDTLPLNEVVTYQISGTARVAHAPKDAFKATVITYAPKLSERVGAVQLFYERDENRLYRRIMWASVGWSDWIADIDRNEALKSSQRILVRATAEAQANDGVYTDMDTFPANEVVSLQITGTAHIAHLPKQSIRATVITFAPKTTENVGMVQAVYDIDTGYTAMRLLWGGIGWTEWAFSYNVNKYTASSIGIYGSFGVIGDSFASGWVGAKDATYTQNYAWSWGQVLARRLGNTCVNYSTGGLTTRTWLTDSNGLTKLNSEQANELYLLCLGINDARNLGTSYIGSASDIATGADTFYGNYGAIINAIRTHAPGAKIVMTSIGLYPETYKDAYEAFNAAISNIANYFSIPYIDVNEDPFFLSSAFKTMVSTHPTRADYGGYAYAMERLFSSAVYTNESYFVDETYT